MSEIEMNIDKTKICPYCGNDLYPMFAITVGKFGIRAKLSGWYCGICDCEFEDE